MQMFATYLGDRYLPSTLPPKTGPVAWSATTRSTDGTVFLKVCIILDPEPKIWGWAHRDHFRSPTSATLLTLFTLLFLLRQKQVRRYIPWHLQEAGTQTIHLQSPQILIRVLARTLHIFSILKVLLFLWSTEELLTLWKVERLIGLLILRKVEIFYLPWFGHWCESCF